MTAPWPSPPVVPANGVSVERRGPASWAGLATALVAVTACVVVIGRALAWDSYDGDPEVEALIDLGTAFAVVIMVPLGLLALAAAICLAARAWGGFVVLIVWSVVAAPPMLLAAHGVWTWIGFVPLFALAIGVWGVSSRELRQPTR